MNNKSNSFLFPGLIIIILTVFTVNLAIQKSHSSLPSDPNWKQGWREVSGFKFPRRALAAVISNNFLYIIGGIDGKDQYVKTVEYAQIHTDGSIGPWRSTSRLLEGRFYLAAASYDGYLYALGGGGGEVGDNNMPLASVERAAIHPDGSLGKWQHHSYLTTPRRGLKAEVVGNHLYAIGGYNGQFLRSTERLDLDKAPQWVLEPNKANVVRYIHATAQNNNHLYLLGGHVNKPDKMSYGDVETATIEAQGNLGQWRISPSRLLTPRFIATAFSLGKYLYIAGGHNGIHRLNSVEMTTIMRDGNVGTWEFISPMLYLRSAAASAVISNRVYVVGGMDNHGVLNTVETAILGPEGKLGHYRTK
jgi:N-acetylneuraminic acid mutarotase